MNSFLLCAIDIFSKYSRLILLKDKECFTITTTFQKFMDKSGRKPNKTWVEKSSEFYNRSLKSWLKNNGTEMYSTHNDGKSVYCWIIY